jgi:hypothetical protein
MVVASRFKRITRPTMPPVRFVYLTIPRYRVNRDQLFQLNKQIADILIKNDFGDDTAQLVLNLERAATL